MPRVMDFAARCWLERSMPGGRKRAAGTDSPVRFGACVAATGTTTPATWRRPTATTTTRRTRTTISASVLQAPGMFPDRKVLDRPDFPRVDDRSRGNRVRLRDYPVRPACLLSGRQAKNEAKPRRVARRKARLRPNTRQATSPMAGLWPVGVLSGRRSGWAAIPTEPVLSVKCWFCT